MSGFVLQGDTPGRNKAWNDVRPALQLEQPRKTVVCCGNLVWGDGLLHVESLSVAYRGAASSKPAVDDACLDLDAGESVGLLGESGCGKTTLARALLRLLPESAHAEGKVLLWGRDLFALPAEELRKLRASSISYISQDPAQALNPVITAGVQVEEVISAHTAMPRAQRKQRALEVLNEVGFPEPAAIYGAYPHQLSGGERQRVAVAQAVACRPALLVADEPTTKLDAPLRVALLELFDELRRRYGMALLLISQTPPSWRAITNGWW